MDPKPMAALPHPDLLDHDSYSESGTDDGQEALEGADGRLLEPVSQPQRRKGGRKPIYSTVEERKQRNRQAQAAFRERRTEYIKQLEITLKEKEDQLQSLQSDSNVNQGIDVESEMRARGGSRGRVSSVTSISPQAANHGGFLPMQHSPKSQVSGNGNGVHAKPKPLKAKIAQLNENAVPTKLETSHMPTPPWQNAPPPHAIASAPADGRQQQDQLYMRRASAYDPHQRTPSGSGLVHGSLSSPVEPAYAVSHGRPFPPAGTDAETRNHMSGLGYGHPSANYATSNGLNTLGKPPPSFDPFYMKELCPS